MSKRLVIVGGGLSGTLVVLNLLREARHPLQILWFDKDGAFGRGLAYSTPHDYHLLNVRASNMSLFADEPTHFTDWLHGHGSSYTPRDFVPRLLYAKYVENTFDSLRTKNPQVNIEHLAEEVTALTRREAGFDVHAGNAVYQASEVILALGNFLPAHPRTVHNDYQASPGYFQNSFSEECLPYVLSSDSVLILGSGLTMIDMVLSLHYHQYKGPVTIISPHGYFPQPHEEQGKAPVQPYLDPHMPYSLGELLHAVNQALKQATREQRHAYSVIDQLRPHIQRLWKTFSLAEKQRFLRHLRHKWGVARHRVPTETLSVVTSMMDAGQVRLVKGRITDIVQEGTGFKVTYTSQDGLSCELYAASMVNCTGPGSDYSQLDSALVRQLLSRGEIRPDPIRYGIEAGADGLISPGVYTLGPPLKGILWESTAIPEIREQACHLARKIIQD